MKELNKNFTIKIFTARNKLLAAKWLIANDLDKFVEDVTNTKDLSWLIVDDRCLKFDGNFDELLENIKNFKPFYK